MKKLVLIPVSIAMMVTDANALDYVNPSPLRVWGDVSTLYLTRDIVGGKTTASNWLNTGSINASSYIRGPWFALINGGLTLSIDETESGEQEPVKSNYVTGKFRFNLFPTSRFPFNLYYNQSRNELDDSFFNRSTKTTEFGIGQQYRSLDDNHRFRAEIKQKLREDAAIEGLEGDSLFLSSSSRFSRHTVSTNILYDRVENRGANEQSNSYSVTGRHSYSEARNFSIENLLSTSLAENNFIESTSDTETAEISSLLSWQPENWNKLSLTGSLRISDLALRQSDNATTVADESRDIDDVTTNINQGLLYQYSRHLLFSEAVNANYKRSENQSQFRASESVGFDYTPDTVTTQVGDYGWIISSTFDNQHGDGGSSRSLSNQLGHSLGNDFSVIGEFQLRTNLTQSLGYAHRSERTNRKSLDHSFSITWTESVANNRSEVRFQIRDSRVRDNEKRKFQLANLQYSGFFRIDRYSRLIGDITLQWTNQEDQASQSKSSVSNGRVTFSHDRLFQVPRLNFKSQLNLSEQQSESERFISALDKSSDIDRSWENSLNYNIGRLQARLNLDFIKSGSDYDRLFKIQLIRSFGDL